MGDERIDQAYLKKLETDEKVATMRESMDPMLQQMVKHPDTVVPDMTGFVDRVSEKMRLGEPDVQPLMREDYVPPTMAGTEKDTLTGKQKPPDPSIAESGRLIKTGLKQSAKSTGQMISNGWRLLGDVTETMGFDRSTYDYVRAKVDEGNRSFDVEDPDYAYKLFHHIFLGVGQAIGDVAKYHGGTKVFNNAVAAMAVIDGMVAYDPENLTGTALAAAKGAGLGELLHLTGPMKIGYRMPFTGGVFAGLTAAEGGDPNQTISAGLTGAMLASLGGRGKYTPRETGELAIKGVPIPDSVMLEGPVHDTHLRALFGKDAKIKEVEAGDEIMGGWEVETAAGKLRVETTGDIYLPLDMEALTPEQKAMAEQGAVGYGMYQRLGTTEDLMQFALSGDFGTLKHESMHYFFEKFGTPEEKAELLRNARRYADANPEKYPNFTGTAESAEEVASDLMASHVVRIPHNVVAKAYKLATDYMGTAESIRAKIRSGEAFKVRKVELREGQRLPGESAKDYQIRMARPIYHDPPAVRKDGRLVGALTSHDSPQARSALIRKFVNVSTKMFQTNPDQALWYEKGGEAIRRAFGLRQGPDGKWTGNLKGADDFMKAVATWSPQMPIGRNTTSATEVMYRLAKGIPEMPPGAVASEATMSERFPDILGAEEVTTNLAGLGPKAVSFYWDMNNATFGIPDVKNATIDSHMIQAFGLRNRNGKEPGGLSVTQYAWARDVMEEVTKGFNKLNGTDFSPRNVQALIWEYNRLGQKVETSPNEDISTHLGVGIITGEVIPAKNAAVAADIHAMPYEAKKRFSDELLDGVLYDEHGRDTILSKLALPEGGDVKGIGGFEATLNPNLVKSLILKGSPKVGNVDTHPLDLYSDIFGYVFSQNSVLRYTPDFNMAGQEGTTHGMEIRLKKGDIPENLVGSFFDKIDTEIGGGINYLGDAIHILNLRAPEGNPFSGLEDSVFEQRVGAIAKAWGEEHGLEIEGRAFGSEAKLREADPVESDAFEGKLYASRIREAGGQGLLDWADSLRKEAVRTAEEAVGRPEAPPKFELKGRRVVDDNGKDVTDIIRAEAEGEGVKVRRLKNEDRVWLMPSGKAIYLGEAELHEAKANMIAGKTGTYRWLDTAEFGASMNAIRFHGLQKTYRWASGKEFAFEVFGPLTKEQRAILKDSVGERASLVVDVTDPATGNVITYAEGKGTAGLKALDRAMAKAYGKSKAQVDLKKEVVTPEGTFPLEHQGWKYEGRWEDAAFHQYTNYDPKSPAYRTTIMVENPETMQSKMDASNQKFAEALTQNWQKDFDTTNAQGEKLTNYTNRNPDISDPMRGFSVTLKEGEDLATRVIEKRTAVESAKSELRFPSDKKGPKLEKMLALDDPAIKGRVKELIREDWGEVDEMRRGTVSFDEAYASAEKLIDSGKFSFQQFLHHKIGTNWPTPEHGIAARMYASRAWHEFANAHAAFEGGHITEADLADFMAVAEASGRVAYGGTAETGRTLAYYRQPVPGASRTFTPEEIGGVSKFMSDLRNSGLSVSEVASKLIKLSPRQLAKLGQELEAPGAWDMFTEMWINALLSNPATHTANAISNLVTMAGLVSERAMAGGNRSMINGVRRAFGMEKVEGVASGESAAMVHAMLEGAIDSFRLAARTVKTGESTFGEGKVEGDYRPAVTTENLKALADEWTQKLKGGKPMDATGIGWMGRSFDFIAEWIIRGPGKALLASDEFFKSMNSRMEISAQAWRRAVGGEGTGETVADRFQFLKDNPTPEMRQAAHDHAKYATFTDKGGEFTAAVMKLRESHPSLRLILPFVKTPSRIAHFSFQRMPILNALSGELRSDLMGKDPVKRDLAVAKIGSSALMAASVAALVSAGAITGGGPRDRNMRELYLANGWMPYSIRIPGTDRWVNYDRTDPIGAIFGVIADYTEVRASMNPEDGQGDIDSIPTAVVLAFTKAFVNKTYMQGFANGMDTVTDPGRNGGKFLRQFAGSFMPAAVGGVTRNLLDPYIREIEGSLDAIKSRTPGYSEYLPPKRDPWGNPSLNHGWGLGLFLPFRHSKWENDPISNELIESGISVPKISKYFGGSKPPLPDSVNRYFVKDTRKYGVKWSDQEYDELARAYGNGLKVDWSQGAPYVVGFGAKQGDGMHDYLNKVVLGEVDLPMAITLPNGDVATKYSELPPPQQGVPGEEMRAMVLRTIMHTYKSMTEQWYLEYQDERSKEKGVESMMQKQIRREGDKAIRQGANPDEIRSTVDDIIPQVGR